MRQSQTSAHRYNLKTQMWKANCIWDERLSSGGENLRSLITEGHFLIARVAAGERVLICLRLAGRYCIKPYCTWHINTVNRSATLSPDGDLIGTYAVIYIHAARRARAHACQQLLARKRCNALTASRHSRHCHYRKLTAARTEGRESCWVFRWVLMRRGHKLMLKFKHSFNCDVLYPPGNPRGLWQA